MNALPIVIVIAAAIILGLIYYHNRTKSQPFSGIDSSQLPLYSRVAQGTSDSDRKHLENFIARSSVAKAHRIKRVNTRRNRKFAAGLAIIALLILAFVNRTTIIATVEDLFAGLTQSLQGPEDGANPTVCQELVFAKDKNGKTGLRELPLIQDTPSCWEIPDISVWNSWFQNESNAKAATARQSLAKSIVENSNADSQLTDPVAAAIEAASADSVLRLPSQSGQTTKSVPDSNSEDSGDSGTPPNQDSSSSGDCGVVSVTEDGQLDLNPRIGKGLPNCWQVKDQAAWKSFFATPQKTSSGSEVTPDEVMEGFASYLIWSFYDIDKNVNQCTDKKYAATCDQIKQAVQDSYNTGVLKLDNLR